MGETHNPNARRLSLLFEQAVDLPPKERLQFIEHVYLNEAELGAELEALLAAYASSSVDVLRQLSREAGGGARPHRLPTSPSQPEAHDDGAANLPREGQQITHYRLLRELGRGGMGAVFLALDTRLHRRVAIKFVHTNDLQMTERFIDEARTTARCQHENIVVVHEVNEHDGCPYMVLEYLEGESLRQYLDRTAATSSTGGAAARRAAALPVEEALAIITQVVRALECAHGRGIIHRDLKPENIFLCKSGPVKILDFGIAKILPRIGRSQQALEAALLTTLHGPVHALTQENALVGTLPYMAPEQWRGEAVQPCTDMWAVGVILHEMLAGAHPLAPLTYRRLETLVPALDTPMPPLSGMPAGTGWIAQLVESCLRKRSAERLAGARPFLEAIAAGPRDRRTPESVAVSIPVPGQPLDAVPSDTLAILVLPASPTETSQMAVRREIRAIQTQLGSSEHQATVTLESEWPMRADELMHALLEHRPDVVHFVGRGDEDRFVLLDDANTPTPVAPEVITRLLASARPRLRLVVLRGSFDPAFGHAIAEAIDAVMTTGPRLDDKLTTRFVAGVYSALAFGRSVQAAAETSVASLALAAPRRDAQPSVQTRKGVDAGALVLVSAPSRTPSSAPPLSLSPDSVRLEFFDLDTSRCTTISRRSITDDWRRRDAEKLDALRLRVASLTSDSETSSAAHASLAEWIPYGTGDMHLVGPAEGAIHFLLTVQSRAASLVVLHTIEANMFHRGSVPMFSPAGYLEVVQRSRALAPLADYTLEAGNPRQPMIPNLALAPGDAISFSLRLLPLIYREFSMRIKVSGSHGVHFETAPFHVSIDDDRSR